MVGDDGVIVIDSAYLPSRARADIAPIRSVTDKPVRYLVNTRRRARRQRQVARWR
ncbi:MAG: hypothetical protein ACREQ8_07820 [Woeseiaceae bacterium]